MLKTTDSQAFSRRIIDENIINHKFYGLAEVRMRKFSAKVRKDLRRDVARLFLRKSTGEDEE